MGCSLISFSSLAADLYVSPKGSDSNPGSQSAPLKTILQASKLAKPGTTVHVASGTYAGGFKTSTSGTASAPITYLSDTKWGAKIVASGSGYIWLNSGNYVTVAGFDMTGPQKTHGLVSAKWASTDPVDSGHHFTAMNNYIHDMATGICGSAGALTVGSLTGHSNIVGNVIRNISRSTQGSCATQQGIYVSEPDTYVANNFISSVSAIGIHQWHGATRSTIVNNTVIDCLWGILVGSGDSGMLPNGSQDNYVANNIVAYNATHGFHEYGRTSNNTYRNNLLFHNPQNIMNAGGNIVSGTINADPQFVNFKQDGSGDYHLKSTSPAIDRGLAQSAPATDLGGNRRPQGAAVDIGAYEFLSGSTPAPTPAPTPTPTPAPSSPVSLSASALAFGSVKVGQKSAVQVVTIQNTGTTTMTIPSSFVMSGDYAFGGLGTCSVSRSYAPGASCTASVVFVPKAKGLRTGSLSIKTSTTSAALVVKLSGTGI